MADYFRYSAGMISTDTFERHPRPIDVVKNQARSFLRTRATVFSSPSPDNSTKSTDPVERAARNADFVNQLLASGQSVREYFERTGRRVRFAPFNFEIIPDRTAMVILDGHLEYFKFSDLSDDRYGDINYPVNLDILQHQWGRNKGRRVIRYFGNLSPEKITAKIASEIK